MASAQAIAALIALNTTATSTKFTAAVGTSLINNTSVTGGWTRSGNTLTWNGADPSIEVSGAQTVNGLQVSYESPLSFAGVLTNINHTGVSLAGGDSIIYTSISFDLTTDDLS